MNDSGARPISPDELRELIRSKRPYALIDVRETGAFSSGHLFLASCLPLSRLELLAGSRLPAKQVPIVLLSESLHDADLTTRAASTLQGLGYTNLQVLPGGTEAWAQAQGEIFTGVNVPSKAFGEFVEHWHDTPRMPAEELHDRLQRGEKIIILDSRPFEEFRRMSIPGGRDCPGAELVYRIHDEIDDPETVVVVNCAGRTRSIIGAQSLINSGLSNPVYALKDGTMGWKLAGLRLSHGQKSVVRPPSEAGLAKAMAAAGAVARKCEVQRIGATALEASMASDDQVTILLDVRTEREYLAGHWPGAIHAPGGQLVQATDEYVMVRNSRLVLCDSADGVRGTMTAHWLLQLGWPDVRVLVDPPSVPVTGHGERVWPLPAGVTEVSAKDLSDGLSNLIALDLSVSRHYKAGHLPGAAWTSRVRLADALAIMTSENPEKQGVVLTGPGDGLLSFAAADIQRLRPDLSVQVLAGGVGAWMAAGFPIKTALEEDRWIHPPDDLWTPPTEGKADPEQAMRQYLEWEVALVDQVNREGLVSFNRLME